MRMKRIVCALALGTALVSVGCAGNRAPVLVAQSGLAVANSIGRLQLATKELTDAKVITPQQALPIQVGLLDINERLKPLPAILRTIEKLQGTDATTTYVDQAIAILEIVGQDVSVVVAGVPVSEATKQLIALVRASQAAVQSVLIEVAKLRGDN